MMKISKNQPKKIVQKVAELKYQEEVNEYQRQRATDYPSMAEQQDMQFHDAVNGTTTWKDASRQSRINIQNKQWIVMS